MDGGPRAALYVPPTPHTNTPPLKPPKKYRGEDEDTEILRCKRRLDFARLGLPMHRPHPETVAKRNERERKRVKQINVTFNTLKSRLPSDLFREKSEKKRSKVDTLRAAIHYIQNLQEMLEEHDAVTALGSLPRGMMPSPGLSSPGLTSPHTFAPSSISPGSTYSTGSEGSPITPHLTDTRPLHPRAVPQEAHPAPLSPEDQELIKFATGWF